MDKAGRREAPPARAQLVGTTVAHSVSLVGMPRETAPARRWQRSLAATEGSVRESVLPASCRQNHFPSPGSQFCRQDADSTLAETVACRIADCPSAAARTVPPPADCPSAIDSLAGACSALRALPSLRSDNPLRRFPSGASRQAVNPCHRFAGPASRRCRQEARRPLAGASKRLTIREAGALLAGLAR